MWNKTALAALALAALPLGACGGGGSSSAPSSTAPAADGVASSPAGAPGAPGPAEGSAAPSAGTSAGTTTVADPCDLLDAGDIKALSGVEVQKGTSQTVSASTLCTWLPKDGRSRDAAVISGQEGPLPGPLSQIEDELKSQFDGKVGPVTVTGADDARYITGKKSGLNIIDVLAQKDGTFFQVLIAAPRDVGQHKGAAVDIAERLIKG